MAISLYYGRGDYSDTINICNMCGWDTDCNVGNVGTILGVMVGIEGISEKWWQPINDFICFSSLVGSENIADIPAGAAEIARVGYHLAQAKPEDVLVEKILNHEHFHHFEYPTSTHTFKVLPSDEYDYRRNAISNTDEQAHTGKRSLKLVVPEMRPARSVKIAKQTYYYSDDFVDSRYDPCFSPIVYPGQKISGYIKTKRISKFAGQARLYAYDEKSKKNYTGEWNSVNEEWTKLEMKIPALNNATIKFVGIEIFSNYEHPVREIFYIDDISFEGKADYSIDFSEWFFDKWNDIHKELEQFTRNRGSVYFEDNLLNISHANEAAELFTGLRRWRDIQVSTEFQPIVGDAHRLYFRVRGAGNCYIAEFGENVLRVITRINSEESILCEKEIGKNMNSSLFVNMQVSCIGNDITVAINGESILEVQNNQHEKGMVGLGNANASRTRFKSFQVKEL